MDSHLAGFILVGQGARRLTIPAPDNPLQIDITDGRGKEVDGFALVLEDKVSLGEKTSTSYF